MSDRTRLWRSAHPDRRLAHTQAQNARDRETNEALRETADRAGKRYTADEDKAVLSDRPAADLARELGRTLRGIERRRERLKKEGAERCVSA